MIAPNLSSRDEVINRLDDLMSKIARFPTRERLYKKLYGELLVAFQFADHYYTRDEFLFSSKKCTLDDFEIVHTLGIFFTSATIETGEDTERNGIYLLDRKLWKDFPVIVERYRYQIIEKYKRLIVPPKRKRIDRCCVL